MFKKTLFVLAIVSSVTLDGRRAGRPKASSRPHRRRWAPIN